MVLMSILLTYSSQSNDKIQLFEAFSAQKFLAALKSSIHSKSSTLSAYLAAISLVLSVDPVSVTIISNPYGLILFKHSSIFFSSFLAIRHTEIGTFDIIFHSPFMISSLLFTVFH